jgi:hypothetical protein
MTGPDSCVVAGASLEVAAGASATGAVSRAGAGGAGDRFTGGASGRRAAEGLLDRADSRAETGVDDGAALAAGAPGPSSRTASVSATLPGAELCTAGDAAVVGTVAVAGCVPAGWWSAMYAPVPAAATEAKTTVAMMKPRRPEAMGNLLTPDSRARPVPIPASADLDKLNRFAWLGLLVEGSNCPLRRTAGVLWTSPRDRLLGQSAPCPKGELFAPRNRRDRNHPEWSRRLKKRRPSVRMRASKRGL